MALISCPECRQSVSDKAPVCPHCGYPVGGPDVARPGMVPPAAYGYEYKSQATVFGMPLVHIVFGLGPGGRLKPARGFIAIGNIAFGVFAMGGFALGVVSLAGIGLGVICLGGVALGLLGAAGGIAIGYVAVGGIAIGTYAIGGLAIGAHTVHNSPELREYLRSIFRRG